VLLLDNASLPPDPWLWEFSERVTKMAAMLSRAPELAKDPPDETAVILSGLFANAGWAVQVRQGELRRNQVLVRPTNEIQREMAVISLNECAAADFPAESLLLASQAIRHCNDRYTGMPEAQVLSDAESLADFGIPYILRQFRRNQSEGRSLQDMIDGWTRQREYSFWDARINDGLRFDVSRTVARQRLADADHCIQSLAAQLQTQDIARVLDELGIESAPPEF
jgi:hypothetical protein